MPTEFNGRKRIRVLGFEEIGESKEEQCQMILRFYFDYRNHQNIFEALLRPTSRNLEKFQTFGKELRESMVKSRQDLGIALRFYRRNLLVFQFWWKLKHE